MTTNPISGDGESAGGGARTYSEAELQSRLELARSVARETAWRDVTRRFTPTQRRHIANLMAHDWTITAIEIQTRFGGTPSRIECEVSLEQVAKEIDEERAKRSAERAKARSPQ